LQFTLPETTGSLEIETEVAWADLKGAVGLRFRNVPKNVQDVLDKWLNERASRGPLAAGSISDAIQ
jgi:hypothetical protein